MKLAYKIGFYLGRVSAVTTALYFVVDGIVKLIRHESIVFDVIGIMLFSFFQTVLPILQNNLEANEVTMDYVGYVAQFIQALVQEQQVSQKEEDDFEKLIELYRKEGNIE